MELEAPTHVRNQSNLDLIAAEQQAESEKDFYVRITQEAMDMHRDPISYAVSVITSRTDALRWMQGFCSAIEDEAPPDTLDHDMILDMIQHDVNYVIGLHCHGPNVKEQHLRLSQVWNWPQRVPTEVA